MPQHEDTPLSRLASARQGEAPFLTAYQLATAQRLERMIARALLTPRLTMSYDSARSGGSRKGAGNTAAEMSDTAAEARQKLNNLAHMLPADCWNVVFDVCGMGKGLQTIETERQWPRRSAKLVLRIALEQLSRHFGLAPLIADQSGAVTRGWLQERPPLIAVNDVGSH